MISPHTPPGTKVVALCDYDFPSFTIKKGGLYTVDQMTLMQNGDVGVKLVGFPHHTVLIIAGRKGYYNFTRDCFRPAALPSCLTEILNRAPIKQTELV